MAKHPEHTSQIKVNQNDICVEDTGCNFTNFYFSERYQRIEIEVSQVQGKTNKRATGAPRNLSMAPAHSSSKLLAWANREPHLSTFAKKWLLVPNLLFFPLLKLVVFTHWICYSTETNLSKQLYMIHIEYRWPVPMSGHWT